MTTDTQDSSDGDEALLTLTSDEIVAIGMLHPPGFPPGVGPDNDDDVDAEAGMRSLAARSLLSDDGRLAADLALVVATYQCATRRANIVSRADDGSRQVTLHVGPELGVTHVGRPVGIHSFALVQPHVWTIDAIVDMALGPATSTDGDGERDAVIDAATTYSVTTVVTNGDGDHRCSEVVITWADGPWVVDATSARRASRTLVAQLLSDL